MCHLVPLFITKYGYQAFRESPGGTGHLPHRTWLGAGAPGYGFFLKNTSWLMQHRSCPSIPAGLQVNAPGRSPVSAQSPEGHGEGVC